MTASNTKPAIPSTESALFAQIGAGLDLNGRATHHWSRIVVPGLVKIYRNREAAEGAKDRMVERVILPKAPAIYSGALSCDLPKKSSKIGQVAFDLNSKNWKATQVPKWLLDHIEGMRPADLIKKQYSKNDAKKMIRTYSGFFDLVTEIKKDARAHCNTTFGRILDHAWPKPKAEAKPKAEGDTKAEGDVESEGMPPVQTAIQLSSGLIAYIQKYEAQIPNHVEAIAAIRKAQLLIGDQQ